MKRFASLALALMLCMGLFTGCGSSSGSEGYDSAMPEPSGREDYGNSLEMGDKAAPNEAYTPKDERKIIYNADVDLESKEFDKTHDALLAQAAKYNAYIQNSEEGGNIEYGSRWVNYSFRVPSEHYREFLNGAAAAGNMVRKQESTEDVTAEYVDVEARITSLENQEARLQELSAQAQTLEDLLAIENQLSNVRYQIESYTGKKRVMDNLITYSTVKVHLNEVEVFTPADDSFTTRMGEAFRGSWKKFVNGLQSFAIGLIYMLPELLLTMAIAAGIIVLLRLNAKRKASKKKAASASAAMAPEPAPEKMPEPVQKEASAPQPEKKAPAYEKQK